MGVSVIRHYLRPRINADPEKAGGAVPEAAIGLAAIAAEHPEARTGAHAALLEALQREFPQKLQTPVLIACLKGLEGYRKADGLERFCKLMEKQQPLLVRILATKRALAYINAKVRLSIYDQVRGDAELSAQPELMVALLQVTHGTRSAAGTIEQRNAALAFQALRSGRYAGRHFGLVRVALVENVFLNPTEEAIEHLIGLLRTDRDWRVRRAVLAKLATVYGNDAFQNAADLAVEDPHPVIKQIALTGLVALKVAPEEALAYRDRLAGQPTAATCEAILRAERIPPDLTLRPAEEVRRELGG